jgi:hypothetical protein
MGARAPNSATRPTTPNWVWSELVITEMKVFPKGRYDDLTDSTTQAIKYIRDNGLLRTDEEEHVWAMDGVRHKRGERMLYAGNNLEKACELFLNAIKHRPRWRRQPQATRYSAGLNRHALT